MVGCDLDDDVHDSYDENMGSSIVAKLKGENYIAVQQLRMLIL